MRLLWKYIRKSKLVYHKEVHFLLDLKLKCWGHNNGNLFFVFSYLEKNIGFYLTPKSTTSGHVSTWSTSGSSAPLRGRSTRGFSALGRGAGAENPPSDLSRPGVEQIFLLYLEEKIFCARARRIHLWIYRTRARNRFSSLYRGENFLRSGAENPPLDLSRPGAEQIFFSIKRRKFSALGRGESTFGSIAPGRGTDFLLFIKEKISALGRGESTFGSIAPGHGTDFLLYIEEKNFCAQAQRIHIWIYRARARRILVSSLYGGENNINIIMGKNTTYFSKTRKHRNIHYS